MTESAPDGIVVAHEPEERRFVLRDGDAVIGLAAYREPDATHRDFLHTEVDDAYGGRGLAGRLVEQALETTRADGRRIIPHCPYVAAWLTRHEGRFDDLVDWPSTD